MLLPVLILLGGRDEQAGENGWRSRPVNGLPGAGSVKRVFLAFLLTFGLVAETLSAATIHFPQGNLSLQDVINRANSGDTIIVAPGTYDFFYDNLLIIHEFLVVQSAQGPQKTVLMGRGKGPVVSFSSGSKAVLDGFTITSRHNPRVVDLEGGGIYCASESAPVIINNVITGNEAVFGAGIYCDGLSAPIIRGNHIRENSALVTGGGIFSFRSTATIDNNLLSHNEAANSGGGIGTQRDSSRINNNIFWKNRAGFGGGVSCDRAATILANNTLVENAADYGGGIVVDKGSVRLTNLILWHNTRDDLYLKQVGPSARPAYSLLGDGSFRGINGNISMDPQFADADSGNFQLSTGSPCIDTGSVDPFYEDTDGTVNDMGAYGGPVASIQLNQFLSAKE
jgi:hypothetical protein